MIERLLCVDSSAVAEYLVPDAHADAATRLVAGGLGSQTRWVAPAFAWAEVGSVLRKKVRSKQLRGDEAARLWDDFNDLPIEYVDFPVLRQRAWEIAQRFGLPTLYDAAFLACTEVAPAPVDAVREFWTADQGLLRSLGQQLPPYVRSL